ncbi:MAG: hypothetical protein Q9160_001696 [Pyrenula sp. 1 TL-2023]
MIVSNSAGKTQSSKHENDARDLESQLGLPVLRHWSTGSRLQKPGIGPYVAQHLLDRGVVSSPQEIAVVGDRMLTDFMMARLMGSWSVVLEDGWRDPEDPTKSYHDIWTLLERRLWSLAEGILWTEDHAPLMPKEQPEKKSIEEVVEAAKSRYTTYLQNRIQLEKQKRKQERDRWERQSRDRFIDLLEGKIRKEEDPEKRASLQRMRDGMEAGSPRHSDKEKQQQTVNAAPKERERRSSSDPEKRNSSKPGSERSTKGEKDRGCE